MDRETYRAIHKAMADVPLAIDQIERAFSTLNIAGMTEEVNRILPRAIENASTVGRLLNAVQWQTSVNDAVRILQSPIEQPIRDNIIKSMHEATALRDAMNRVAESFSVLEIREVPVVPHTVAERVTLSEEVSIVRTGTGAGLTKSARTSSLLNMVICLAFFPLVIDDALPSETTWLDLPNGELLFAVWMLLLAFYYQEAKWKIEDENT